MIRSSPHLCYKHLWSLAASRPLCDRRSLFTYTSHIYCGINLTNRVFKDNWKRMIRRAMDVGVYRIVSICNSTKSSKDSLKLAHKWYDDEEAANLHVTIGVHSHDAKFWDGHSAEDIKLILKDSSAVALGECGLDYNRNCSSKSDQIHAFRE